MALTKTILKKKRQQAVVHLVGTGNATISVHELALPDETLDFANVPAVVNITGYYYSIESGPMVVSRNGNVVLNVYGTDNWEFSQQMGFVLNQDNSSNIVVDFGAANGTAIFVLTKAGGYQEPDTQRFVSGN